MQPQDIQTYDAQANKLSGTRGQLVEINPAAGLPERSVIPITQDNLFARMRVSDSIPTIGQSVGDLTVRAYGCAETQANTPSTRSRMGIFLSTESATVVKVNGIPMLYARVGVVGHYITLLHLRADFTLPTQSDSMGVVGYAA